MSLGASPETRRPVAGPPSWWSKNGPLLDLSGAYIPKLENSRGSQIHPPFVHMASRLVKIELYSCSTITFNGASTILAPSSKLMEWKCSGDD
ncbi:hypothetical protein JCGZ_22172 [Jatropha curcas]|uniref:Uncharacterized protein n=1 Tax=Jatropha curcas TaxID=180498 RepID=A0A067LIX1_JATCU|nr:hypothetical protein JCGZ_22172 [Jatropha curcas]